MIRRIYISILFICVSLSAAYSQDTREQESRKARLEREIAIIDRQISENAQQSNNELSQLNLVRKKISTRRELIAENDRKIRACEAGIRDAGRQINELESRLDTLSEHYSGLVRSAYKNRDTKIWYMYILASENLGQAFRRIGYFRNLSAEMKRQADRIRETREELEEEKKSLESLKRQNEELKAVRTKELSYLETEEQQSRKVISELQRNRRKYERELNEKKRQVEALDREIQRLIADAMSSKGKSDKPAAVDYKLAAEFAANKGKLPWPVEGPVIEKFGQNYHPVFKTVKLPFNNGISIAVPKGTPVMAVFDGVVKQIGVMPGYNQCILVQHGDYFSFYCKLKTSAVKPGDKVKTGQVLGVVDTINGETQLHFQIWQKQKPQNPEVWLRKR